MSGTEMADSTGNQIPTHNNGCGRESKSVTRPSALQCSGDMEDSPAPTAQQVLSFSLPQAHGHFAPA